MWLKVFFLEKLIMPKEQTYWELILEQSKDMNYPTLRYATGAFGRPGASRGR